jgi:hypothetical protein
MPNHPTNWPSQRHHLTQALKHLSKFTDNLQTFLELSDEAEAQVLTLDFGTSSVIAVMDELRAEAIADTNMANRAKPSVPSRAEYPNQRKPWTFDDEQAVRSALMLGFDKHWIAERLGRNTRAVQERIEVMRKAGQL